MRKSIGLFVVFLMLSLPMYGCSQDSFSEEEPSTHTNPEEQSNALAPTLTYQKGHPSSASNEHGYYYVRTNHGEDAHGDPYMNIMYIDYETKKEVYLCNKSNCSHNDESCSSYLNNFGAFGLFLYEDKLYQFVKEESSTQGNASLSSSAFIPTLYVSDLDGSNRKQVTTLASGNDWSDSFVFGEGFVYASLEKHEIVQDSDGTMNDTVTENKLVSIDLSSGASQEVTDLKDKDIVGAFDSTIVFNEIEFTTNQGDYLKQLQSANLVYSGFDMNTKTMKELTKIAYPESYISDKNMLYYIPSKETNMMHIDLKNGTSNVVVESLSAIPSYMYTTTDYILCIITDQAGTSSFYAIDRENNEIYPIDLYQNSTDSKIEIDVLAESLDSFLVRTGNTTKKEYVAWAGIEQDTIIKESFALISKSDFLSGTANYIEITNAKNGEE